MKRLILTLVLLFGVASLPAQEPADSLAAAEQPVQAPDSVGESPVVEAFTPDQLWDRANTAYINGDYHAAIATYGELLDRGYSSAKLYFNLGNACFKEGETGRAILCYHRALRLAPGNDDIRYNLSVAESRTKDRIEAIPEFSLRNGCVPCATR